MLDNNNTRNSNTDKKNSKKSINIIFLKHIFTKIGKELKKIKSTSTLMSLSVKPNQLGSHNLIDQDNNVNGKDMIKEIENIYKK